jgi:NADH:ubiquinone oxidoreductase subunit 2 (subunit N)
VALSLISGITRVIITLVILEILSWVFVILLETRTALKYLLVQRYFMLGSIMCLLWCPLMLIFFILIKIGLPPFHIWLVSIMLLVRWWVFLFGITGHKIYPIFVLGELVSIKYIVLTGILVLIFRRALLVNSSILSAVLIYSSIVHRGWILLGFLVRKGLVGFYWMVYTVALFMIVFSMNSATLLYSIFNQNSSSRVVWLLLRGIPPFAAFWLKVRVLCSLWLIGIVITITALFSAVIVLRVYYNMFHFRVTSLNNTYYNWGVAFLFFGGLIGAI